MKKILHVVGGAIRGGCETNCAVFIRHSPGLRHHVLVLGEQGPMSELWRELGATVTHLEILEDGWSSFRQGLRSFFATLSPDGAIVWVGIRVPLVLAALKCPTVLHAGNPFAAGRRIRGLLTLAGWLLPRPRVVSILACSQHTAVTYQNAPYYRLFSIQVCLNPIESPATNPHRTRVVDPTDLVRIGMVARLDPIKDHATLLRAFALLHARRPGAELHLAGDGPLRPELELLAQELGVGEAVRFHGSIGGVPEFLGRLDLFCYLTTESEGMGNALAESLAHGLPCVVTDLPVMYEVAGEGGQSVARYTKAEPSQVDQVVEELLGDVAARQWLSTAAWERARALFSPGQVVARYLSALQIQ